MAKVSFTKLGLKRNDEIKTFEFNGQIIEVKQYLPVEKKLEFIARVIELSHDENNFSNPVKIKVFTSISFIEYYTNICFTDKQKEDVPKLYDTIKSFDFFENILNLIPKTEIDDINIGIQKTIDAFYAYKNSIYGILETINQDYNNVQTDIGEITAQMSDLSNLDLIKDIMSKLG